MLRADDRARRFGPAKGGATVRKLRLSKRNQWVEALQASLVKVFAVWVKERPEFRNVAFGKAWAAFELDLQKRLIQQFKPMARPAPAALRKEVPSCAN